MDPRSGSETLIRNLKRVKHKNWPKVFVQQNFEAFVEAVGSSLSSKMLWDKIGKWAEKSKI